MYADYFMNYTDTQLKQALAKILPPNLIVWYRNPQFPSQAALRYCANGAEVLDTELLHLCWLVEEGLTPDQRGQCANFVYSLIAGTKHENTFHCDYHATWQQRTIALAKVKGIEI